MKNRYTTPADFWQERDFGAKITATFEFIGAHFRMLFKCLVYFVLPVTLIMGIGLGLLNNSIYNLSGQAVASRRLGGPVDIASQYGSSPFSMFNFNGMALAILGVFLAYLMLSGTVFGFLRARLRLPAHEPVTPAQTWAELWARLGRMALGFLLLLVLGTVIFSLFVGGLIGGISAIKPGVMASVLAVILAFIPLLYVSVTLSLYLPVLWLEDHSIFASIGRCFQLIKNRWWPTLGLMLVAGIIQSTLSIVFIIPQYVVMIGKMLQLPGINSDFLGLVANCIYAVGIIFTYTVSLLALTFQYFHLVEQKDGLGLRLLVDKLGAPQTATLTVEPSFYRPDDEGEY